MKERINRIVAGQFLLLICVFVISCQSYKEKEDQLKDTPERGMINVSADESFKPIIDAQVQVYEANNPGTKINVQYKPEAECLKDFGVDSIRVIIATRGYSEQEERFIVDSMKIGPVKLAVARDAIAVIVNPLSPDSMLKMSELKDILTGKFKKNLIPVFDGAQATSTVRFIVDSVLHNEALTPRAMAAHSSEEVINYVATHGDAIGLIGVSWIGNKEDTSQVSFLKKVKIVWMESTDKPGGYVLPLQENIYMQRYPMVRDLVYILKENHRGLGYGFTDFLSGNIGQLIFKRAYLVPTGENLFSARYNSRNEQSNYIYNSLKVERKMKKISITFLFAALLGVSGVFAQSLQEGINDVYARRYQSARATFEKLLSANPNNIDATYWLGQDYIEMNDVAGAKAVYEKALLASANAPLVIVGMGQVELLENKVSEARQRFEAAITMTRAKKGDDPVILNAVGRAITQTYNDKEKKGDINYAIEKLEAAALRDPKNPEIFLNLGNAYRKARPGEGGGKAFETYKRGIEANPNFPVNYYRIAQLFYSQRNWELYEQYLNEAITHDPKFAPAYYDLSYYKMGKMDFVSAEANAKKYTDNSDPNPNNDYLRASILYFQKNYDGSIELAKSILSKAGDKADPTTYKLIAYDYVDKKDTQSARPFIDQYFAKEAPEEILANDYKLKADIYSAIPGQEDVVLQSYLDGVKADTVLENRIDLLKKGVGFFAARKQYDKEAKLHEQLLAIKPNLTINDYFAAGISNYRAKQFAPSYEIFKVVSEKFPDQSFGWEWMYNNASLIDTVKKDSIAVPAAIKWLEFAQKDSVKYAKQISGTSYFLATYYLDKGDKPKAIEHLKIMKTANSADPAMQEEIQKQIDKLSRPGSTGGSRSQGSK